MNDKQDRPYACGAPGCSQVSLATEQSFAGKYLIIILRLGH